MPSWDPDVYERYKTYRDRPALDLLLQIPADLGPEEIWDLGCGTGEHAALLAARHPLARVHGLDSSADMLAQARRRPAGVDWRQGDIADFDPATPPHLIFSNAALHWLGDHQRLIPRLANLLSEGGVLAIQMPISFTSAWHVAMRDVAEQPACLGRDRGRSTPGRAERLLRLAGADLPLDRHLVDHLSACAGGR
jgi:trans-aconitate 2-methyltransferase